MCWNPYDAAGGMQQAHLHSEKPYSVGDIRFSAGDAYLEPDTGGAETAQMGFTVKDLGRQSGQLIQMQVGDWLAIRGPYGNSFPNPQADSRLVLVSGGIGSTPMYMAAWDARRRLGDRILIEAVLGFRNQAESHFIERMQRVCDRVEITTDDGSLGQQGFPTSALVQILSDTTSAGSDPSTRVYTCGPEVMMAGVLSMAQEYGIEAWAAMERYLPCSMAVCGLCMIGDRLTCRDGPVMEGEWLLQQADFGAEQAHMH
jgi:dihydroorotate dehydrogenase electron transfer subunit